MPLVDMTIKVTDTNKPAFEAFVKSLIGPQSPVPGDRLFKLAISTKEQRDKNLVKHKEDREIIKRARAEMSAKSAGVK